MMTTQTLSLPRAFRFDGWFLRLSLALSGLLALVQMAASGLVGTDGYYHVKMAALMRADLTPDFIWLPLTILKPESYYDHHWLFHVLLSPFAGGNLILGGQIAAVVFAAAALAAGGWLLRTQHVPGATLWTIGMVAASSAFIYRLLMPRAQSLSLLWLIVAMYLMIERRERWLIVLGLTYVWLYDAFPLLLVVAGVYFVAARLVEGQWRWSVLIYSAIGLGLGLVFNPYFPQNLTFIYHHLIAKLDIASVKVGSEWYPYTTAQLMENSGVALAAFVTGAFALGWQRQRLSLPAAFSFGLSIVFGIMLLASRRFVEYFPAFAVLFCAFAWQPVLAERQFGRRLVMVLTVIVLAGAAYNVYRTRDLLQNDLPAEQFAGASEWLTANTPEGSLVFQTDWDDFTRLFFYNTHNVYTVGLDPTYLQRADPDLYYLWVDITQGRGLDLSSAIREHFNAEYVVSDLKHKAFLERAEADPQFEEVYRDENSVVFKVTD
ncbi:MAG: hypothetical protein HYZ49_02060 [Chloroflexi bacterium]|nr:hypothetical protein [Chloroflexota bacterium]